MMIYNQPKETVVVIILIQQTPSFGSWQIIGIQVIPEFEQRLNIIMDTYDSFLLSRFLLFFNNTAHM